MLPQYACTQCEGTGKEIKRMYPPRPETSNGTWWSWPTVQRLTTPCPHCQGTGKEQWVSLMMFGGS